MIVLQIHIDCVGAIPIERDSPVAGNPDRLGRVCKQPQNTTSMVIVHPWHTKSRLCRHALAAHPAEPVKVKSQQIELLRPGRPTIARKTRPTLAAFVTLNPAALPVSK
jgi:hypothetical protein